MDNIHDIYDRIAKRCLSLSAKSTLNLINVLYQTDYPLDSKVTFNLTESHDDELHRTLADTIITINDTDSYHMEFQMEKDGDIIFRVLEYGFHHALKSRSKVNQLCFPEPMIIYLYDRESFPDEYELEICFGKHPPFLYKVPVFKYLKKSMAELEERKLIAFIPFQLLRLRRAIEKERSPENVAALKKLITHDIIDSINYNLREKNITHTEAVKLSHLILLLYHHIYDRFEELEQEGIVQMAEDALIFDVDILEHEIKQLKKDCDSLIQEKESLAKEKDSILEEKDSILKEKDSIAKENVSLKEELHLQKTETKILRLSAKGLSPEAISQQLQLSPEFVCNILNAE